MFSEKSIFDPILMPTWLHLETTIHQHPFKNKSQEASKKLSHVLSMCLSRWLRFGSQGGAMLAPFPSKMGRCLGVFLRYFRRPDPILAPCWVHCAASGTIWARFWRLLFRFWDHFGAMLDPLGARADTGWAGGVMRSESNSKCSPLMQFQNA